MKKRARENTVAADDTARVRRRAVAAAGVMTGAPAFLRGQT